MTATRSRVATVDPSEQESPADHPAIFSSLEDGSYAGMVIDLQEQVGRFKNRSDIGKKVDELAKSEKSLIIEVNKLFGVSVHGPAYKALTSSIGETTPIYKFYIGSKGTVQGVSFTVKQAEVNDVNTVVVVDADNNIIPDAEFIGYKLGVQGFAYVRLGPVILKVAISPSATFVELDKEREYYDFKPVVGTPALRMVGSNQLEIDSMATLNPPCLYPKNKDDVPWGVTYTIVELLPVKARYGNDRLVVADSDGVLLKGVVAEAGIRQVCGKAVKTDKNGTTYVLNENSVGKRFQIDGARARVNKKGEALNVNGMTEAEFKKDSASKRGEVFKQATDVMVSDPDDFALDL